MAVSISYHITSSIMSAPNVNKPNEGIVGQVANSVGNAVNYVSDTLQGNVSWVETSLSNRVSNFFLFQRLPKSRRRRVKNKPRAIFREMPPFQTALLVQVTPSQAKWTSPSIIRRLKVSLYRQVDSNAAIE